MKRLVFVQLPMTPIAALAPSGNVPLAAASLAVATRQSFSASELEIELADDRLCEGAGDTLLGAAIAKSEPELVAFSLYMWNSERSLHVAREVKRLSPRTQIVIGGPEVARDNSWLWRKGGFDLAVSGEAEHVMGSLVRQLLARASSPGTLAGIANDSGRLVEAPAARFALADYPSPYLDGFLPVAPNRSVYVETMRGCRSRCSFCFYPRSSRELRTLAPAQVRQVVGALIDRGAQEIVFLDPSFNLRPGLGELLRSLADLGRGRVAFVAEMRPEGITAEVAQGLARAGFRRVELGLQSVNRATLKRLHRGGDPNTVARAARELMRVGIRPTVDLMVGLPGDGAADVAAGVDFLLAHDLAADAQVFPLSVLPGTELRATAAERGLRFDAAPPYHVRATPELGEDGLSDALFAAEERLLRRIDESPRALLSEWDESCGPRDLFRLDLDETAPGELLALAGAPAAQHVSFWLSARDLYGRRELIGRLLERRLSVDPFATLDVVLNPQGLFPLDLVDVVTRMLANGHPSYTSRVLALRGEDAQRRLSVVLPAELRLPAEYLSELVLLVPTFREQSFARALTDAPRLGLELPMARILDGPDAGCGVDGFAELARLAEADAVSFAQRALERRWVETVLGWREL